MILGCLMLLDKGGTTCRIPPGIWDIEVGWNSYQSIVCCSVGTAVLRPHSGSVDTLDWKFDEFEFVIEALTGHLDDGVQRNFHVG